MTLLEAKELRLGLEPIHKPRPKLPKFCSIGGRDPIQPIVRKDALNLYRCGASNSLSFANHCGQAKCGYEVSVQYCANQPEYDLMVAKGERLLKISVKGSQDGGWGLCQSYLKNADYHAAIDCWAERHKPRTVLCFVQFRGIKLSEMPRVYLATAAEVAERLHTTAKGRGDTILYERHEWGTRAHGAGTVEEIPPAWIFSAQRIESLLNAHDRQVQPAV